MHLETLVSKDALVVAEDRVGHLRVECMGGFGGANIGDNKGDLEGIIRIGRPY